ncbi:zinc finger protein 511 isoform 2-T2 [Thomomys bottae]
MLLPPALCARLAGAPGASEPLPVERDPAAGAAPFRFAARPVRFTRDHEFFEDILTQVAAPSEKSRVPEFTCQVAGCCQVFAALEDYQHHYHMLHRNVCSLCNRAFPSGHLLETHVLEWHDSLFQILAEKQDMYQCLVEGCPDKFKTSQDRKDHMVRLHLYPADFRFDKPKTSRGSALPPASAGLSTGAPHTEDPMEVYAEDTMEISSAATAQSPCGRTYSPRVPSTICFGQGACRGFKSTKKRKKHH